MPGFRSLSRLLRATTGCGDVLLGLGFLLGGDGLGLELVLRDGQLGDLVVQDADRPILLDRHADLELHLLDDPLAQGGHVRLFDPVDPRQLFEDQGLDRRVGRRWAAPPVWASAAALSNKQPAASAAIGFETDMIGRASSPPGCCRAQSRFTAHASSFDSRAVPVDRSVQERPAEQHRFVEDLDRLAEQVVGQVGPCRSRPARGPRPPAASP